MEYKDEQRVNKKIRILQNMIWFILDEVERRSPAFFDDEQFAKMDLFDMARVNSEQQEKEQ